MSCTCSRCSEQYRVDINIPTIIWDKINPLGKLLCGNCIIKELEGYGYSAYVLTNTKPRYLYHCTNNIEEIKRCGILWGNSIGDYSSDSARRTFLSIDSIKKYGNCTIRVDCDNYTVVDMGNGEYIINEPIAFHRDCEVMTR